MRRVIIAICMAALIVALQPGSAQAVPIYIDASSGTPVVYNNGYMFPLPGVSEIAPDVWAISIGLLGAYRGITSSDRGVELTDNSGNILDSFGLDSIVWSELYSYSVLYTTLYTVNEHGVLSGRTPRITNAIIDQMTVEPDQYQLAMTGITTEWYSFEIYLRGYVPPSVPEPVPEPATILLLLVGLPGIVAYARKCRQ